MTNYNNEMTQNNCLGLLQLECDRKHEMGGVDRLSRFHATGHRQGWGKGYKLSAEKSNKIYEIEINNQRHFVASL